MIKNLVFDLGGVILPLNRVACLRAFDEVLGYKDFGDILSSYRHSGFFEKFENGDIGAEEFRSIIRSHSDHTVSDDEIDYSLNSFIQPIPKEKLDALLSLKESYRMVLLSNTNPICFKKTQEFFLEKGCAIENIFPDMFLSYVENCSKPDNGIYLKLIEKTGIVPQESLYIDDASANIEAGTKLGFKTLLYNIKEDLYDKVLESVEREQR